MTRDMPGPILANLLLFVRELRAVGIPVAQDQTTAALRALDLVDVGAREQVFHSLRTLLVNKHEHLRLFETLFNQFFARRNSAPGAPRVMPRAPRHKAPEKLFDITTYMAFKARYFDEEIDVGDKSQSFSAGEALQRKDFSQMAPEELDTLRALIREMDWSFTRRRTRRRVPATHGSALDLRRVLRSAAKTGGVPARLHRQARKIKPRPIVLLADVSGSMEKYSRVLLLFFHCVTQRMRNVNSFVFGTRLSEVTQSLKLRNIDIALDQAGRDVLDWAGGTRIGESLRAFNRQYARRVLRRGAICMIVSDGWERGDCGVLKQEMRYLQHRSHRLIWLNPLVGQGGYEARVEGMQAALPYIDDFLPIHNLESLRALNAKLATL